MFGDNFRWKIVKFSIIPFFGCFFLYYVLFQSFPRWRIRSRLERLVRVDSRSGALHRCPWTCLPRRCLVCCSQTAFSVRIVAFCRRWWPSCGWPSSCGVVHPFYLNDFINYSFVYYTCFVFCWLSQRKFILFDEKSVEITRVY